MVRRRLITLFCATLALALSWSAQAQDWKSQMKEFRLGLLGGENTQSRLARYDAFKNLLQE